MIQRLSRRFCAGTSESKLLISRISDRRLSLLKGKDLPTLLKGLSTNNTLQFLNDKEQIGQHTLFLNSKGKIITDAMLIKPQVLTGGELHSVTGQLWLESHAEHTPELLNHLKQYSFRKEVQIEDISERIDTVCLYHPDMVIEDSSQRGKAYPDLYAGLNLRQAKDIDNVDFAIFDPRSVNLGIRIYSDVLRTMNWKANESTEVVDEDYYDMLRFINQIPQGNECKDEVPSRMNFDLLSCVDLNKGCFLGQELTARAHYTGVIRKRPFFVIARGPEHEEPFSTHRPKVSRLNYDYLDKTFERDLKGKVIKDKAGNKSLKILSKPY